MSENNRRDFIKYGLASATTLTVPSIASAKEESPQETAEEFQDITVIAEDEDRTYIGLVTSKNGVESSTIAKVTNSGNVYLSDVSMEVYSSLTSDVSTMSVDTVQTRMRSIQSDHEEVVKRSDAWEGTNGECDAYDYTHPWFCVTAEFKHDISDVGIAAAGRALVAIAGATLSTGGAALAAGVIAGGAVIASWLIDVYEVTIGAIEYDKSAWNWTQTFTNQKANKGYHVPLSDLVSVGIAPSHVARNYPNN